MKRAFGISVPEGLRELCTRDRCALIVYDMQAGIVPQISDGKINLGVPLVKQIGRRAR